MIIAIIVGVIVGLVALIPFYFATKGAKKIDPAAGSFAMLGPFLLTIVISFAILVVSLAIGKMLTPDFVAPLAIAEFVAFVLGVIIFAICIACGKTKSRNNINSKNNN